MTDMAALTDVLPGPNGPLPLLILDQRPEMAVRSDPAERVSPSVSALLSLGLTLVDAGLIDLRFLDGASTTVSEPPAPAPGRLELSALRAARLTARKGRSYTTGNAASPGRGAR
jgi:hypothetical protein